MAYETEMMSSLSIGSRILATRCASFAFVGARTLERRLAAAQQRHG
jgi:hypothetical protein